MLHHSITHAICDVCVTAKKWKLIMTHYSITTSRPDHWTSPRPYSDASLRAMTYGRVRPMYEPNWWARMTDRLFGRV